jgi:sulfur carrier protein
MSAANGSATLADGGAVIQVNDEPRMLAGETSVAALVSDLGLTGRKGIAVAVNGTVVPRTAWLAHVLRDADRVLIIRATQGG